MVLRHQHGPYPVLEVDMIVLSQINLHLGPHRPGHRWGLRADVDEIAKLCADLAAAGFNEPTTWH